MLWSFKDSIRSESQKDKLIFLLNTEHNNPLEIFKNGCIFILCLKVKHHIFSILNLCQWVDGVKRRLDPSVSGQSWNLSIYLCRDWNNYYRIGYSPPAAGLWPPTKREKNTREIKYCPGGSQRCSTKWASFIMILGIIIKFLTKSCDHGGMSSLMQLRFSDIVSLDADTFFIPLSLCFQSAIKVIGVCEYFDSMVKSDNCDLKWPLEDVKFRQDLRLSLQQIQMIPAHHSWLLLIGWSTLFFPLIGKSRNSTSLSGWCLCLERQPVWTLWQSRFLTWWNSTTLCSFLSTPLFLLFQELLEPNCCADLSTQLRHIILSPRFKCSVSFKYSKEGKKLSPRVKFLWTEPELPQASASQCLQCRFLIGHWCQHLSFWLVTGWIIRGPWCPLLVSRWEMGSVHYWKT